jgi:hypothetical protein
MPVFAQKYLTRYTHETFFEKYVNFQNHYLSHYGVILVQSFGSHIRPQPHGLGLKKGTVKTKVGKNTANRYILTSHCGLGISLVF